MPVLPINIDLGKVGGVGEAKQILDEEISTSGPKFGISDFRAQFIKKKSKYFYADLVTAVDKIGIMMV